MSNQLWIESHLEGPGHSFSFDAIADQEGCGGVYHSQSGNITAPLGSDGKYRHGIRCSWDIESQPGYRIQVAFNGRFDIEQNEGCNNDYVQIVAFDEASQAWQWTKAKKYCGRQVYVIPNFNNAHRLRVIFRSNNDVNGDGFNVRTFNFQLSSDFTYSNLTFFSFRGLCNVAENILLQVANLLLLATRWDMTIT